MLTSSPPHLPHGTDKTHPLRVCKTNTHEMGLNCHIREVCEKAMGLKTRSPPKAQPNIYMI